MSFKVATPIARALASSSRVAVRSRVLPIAQQTAFRYFSVSRARFGNGESDAQLSAAIAAEHTFELEEAAGQPEVPEFLEQFKSQGIWEIKDIPGSDDVILNRRFGDEKIRLTFQISDLDPLESSPIAESSASTDTEAIEESESAPYITCSLVITKSSVKDAMSIDMEAGEDGMVVTNVAMFGKEFALMDGSEGDWIRRGKYMGPQFEHLDTGVQDAFQAYLAERGIDDGLAQFILSYAEYKEQKDYIEWLEQVKAFVGE